MARSAQHEVHVELNHNSAVSLCTLRQRFQFNGIRLDYRDMCLLVISPFIVSTFLAETIQYQGFDTFYGTKRQYHTGPAFEDILSINDHQTLTLIFRGIKHIARRAYPGQNFNNLHPALFAIRTLIYIELG